ncbi:MAG: neuraminidase-like domain-containing protein [Nitrospirales bacterium]|nr:neuraminidase-like domain-containing protein [Nitrospirales bacterium]
MELDNRELELGLEGQDVSLLHKELIFLGFPIGKTEVQKNLFGQETRAVVVRFQKSQGLDPAGIVDKETAASINKEVAARQKKPFTVQGTVRLVDGRPVTNSTVQAVHVELRKKLPLKKGQTDATGHYSLSYDAKPFMQPKGQGVNLQVSLSVATEEQPIQSTVLYNARPLETVDLVAGGDKVREASEYENLLTALKPLLNGTDLAELDAKELLFLSEKSEQPLDRLQLLVEAQRLKNRTKLDAEIYYGLFRQGLPTDRARLLAQDADLQKEAMQRAIEENLIPVKYADPTQQKQVLGRLKALIVEAVIDDPIDPDNPAYKTLLETVLDRTADQKTFLEAYVNYTGEAKQFWANLKRKPEFRDKVGHIQFALQLGALTKLHVPLVKELQRQNNAGNITALEDLAKYDEQGWLALIKTKVGSGVIGVPPGIPGDNEPEQQDNYARGMARMVEAAFPTAFIKYRIAAQKDELDGGEDLDRFFKNNPKFEIPSMRLEPYLSKNPNALRGIAKPEETKKQVKGLQRLYALTPRFDHVAVLLKAGVDSAHAISGMGSTTFEFRFGGKEQLGSRIEARKLFEKAENVRATTLMLLTEFGLPASRVPTRAVPDKTLEQVEGIPDWSTLFDSLDLCECQHCQSIFSPAAYLVDILEFLKDRQLIERIDRDDAGAIRHVTYKLLEEGSTTIKTAKDVLFDRRSDMGDIELNCENTNTPIPSIDLVNETLEDFVAPPPLFEPFTVPIERLEDLDNRNLTRDLRAAFGQHLPSEHAVITVKRPGEEWAIEDLPFSYKLRKDGSQINVASRSRQTKWSVQELAANPQYVNPKAYEILRDRVYPWELPFDLWTEEVRTYLGRLGVQRHDIMETFSLLPRGRILPTPDIAHEFLGLTGNEVQIITGAVKSQRGAPDEGVWNLWGFSKRTLDATNAIPNPSPSPDESNQWIANGEWLSVLTRRVDVFLQQSGLQYKDLLQLLGTYFINAPNESGKRPITIQSADAKDEATCDLSKLKLVGMNQDATLLVSQFVRLFRKLQWSIYDLDRAVTALKPGDLNGQFLVQVSAIKRLEQALRLPLIRLLAFWAQIDSALYTDHETVGQPLIPTLYAQLFRSKTDANPLDPTFTQDPKALIGKISEHVPAISAALEITASDFFLLFNDGRVFPRRNGAPDDTLSIDNLSHLYRHTILAKSLRLTIRGYLSTLALTDGQPFTSPIETVLFVERIQNVRDSGWTVTELDYLLRHEFIPSAQVAPAETEVAISLEEIRRELQQIARENTFVQGLTEHHDAVNPDEVTVDSTGDLTKQKLALLAWDSSIIEKVVATLNGVTAYSESLDALPEDLQFPPSFVHRISYDATLKRLQFSGVMTEEERDTLKSLPHADDEFKNALDSLFTQPRIFLNRIMRAFSVHEFSAPLSSLPTDLEFPSSLKGKVFYNLETQTLHFLGVMSTSEKRTLDSLSTDHDYKDAVQRLFDAADTFDPEPGDRFLTISDGDNDIKTLLDSGLTTEERFALILRRLMPYLRKRLSQAAVIQKIADALNIESRTAENLLTKWLPSASDPLEPAIVDFISFSFVESHVNVRATKTTFPEVFDRFLLLSKIALVISKFKMSPKELGWLFNKIWTGKAGWLDLASLSVVPMDSIAGIFESWERLVNLMKLRDALPAGKDFLDEIFGIVFSLFETAVDDEQKNAAKGVYVRVLHDRALWSEEDLMVLLGSKDNHREQGSLEVVFPRGYQSEWLLLHLHKAFRMLNRLGMVAREVPRLLKREMNLDTALRVKQAVRARYNEEQWGQLARPLRDELREKQRAALVHYVLSHPSSARGLWWRNANEVYAHFLLDVEMSPCQMTSRIKQAIGSVQLFVQRALMNLEREVLANAEIDANWKQWTWMEHYRIWEANRKVFLMPENWIEPELRDDKSPFFLTLENELMQNELTEETAEITFRRYLENLDQVARLEIVGMYHEVETLDGKTTSPKLVDVLHVFGRTRNEPHVYYYRRRVNASFWTAWERVDVDVQGDHLIPIIWNRRLYLFWPVFSLKQEEKTIVMPETGQRIEGGGRYWEIQLAWSELKNGKWLPKKITTQAHRRPSIVTTEKKEDTQTQQEKKEKAKYVFSVLLFESPYDKSHWLQISYEDGSFSRMGIPEYYHGYFTFSSCDGNIYLHDADNIERIRPPGGSNKENMMFVESSENKSGILWLHDLSGQSEVQVLTKPPSQIPFRILYPHQDFGLTGQRPFFFQDATKTFFIGPTVTLTIEDWANADSVDPGNVESFQDSYSANNQANDYSGLLKVFPDDPYQFQPSFEVMNTNPFDIERKATPKTDVLNPKFNLKQRYLFETFYHPYVCEFVRHLLRDGIKGLLQRPVQLASRQYFKDEYKPTIAVISGNPLLDDPDPRFPIDVIDFSFGGAYSLYNWEIFFHAPLLIADRLRKNQRFEDARKWFHYIFDPTDTSGQGVPERYWQTKPFYETATDEYRNEKIPNLLRLLASRGSTQERNNLTRDQWVFLMQLEGQVREWRNNPFQPHVIARLRTTAYQKSVVMKYMDNLIAWGDQLFRRYTLESINAATQYYILAANILGKRPEEISSRATLRALTYNDVEFRLGEFSNALIEVENFIPPSVSGDIIPTGSQHPMPTPLMLLFCAPKNEKLLQYWDIVEDRLFKIRHCQNIEGRVRELPLFEPPIDPGLLVKAAAAGVDITSVLNDMNAALPHYRFAIISQKATELVNDLKALGSALLGALEKRDAERLALLRSTHEVMLLNAVRDVREKQINEATETLESLRKSRELATIRQKYYSTRPFLLSGEAQQLKLSEQGVALQEVKAKMDLVANTLFFIPDIKGGSPFTIGFTLGGQFLGNAMRAYSAFFGERANILHQQGSSAATLAGYQRRSDDWSQQLDLATKEIEQVDRQIIAAEIRLAIVEKELKNHEKQIENSKQIDEFMREKFTNQQLYDWMVGQLSGVYFQSYQLAYGVAKKAERAYQYELGLRDSGFINFGYWDSLKKGLLAGERLSQDLKRMEVAFLDQNKREDEMVKHISLSRLDPVGLIQLKQTGECFVRLPEVLFDLDGSGQYMRRIKTVSLTIPCVTGPYTGVNCKLTLLRNFIRHTNTLLGGKYGRQENDPRFIDQYGSVQSIVTSSAQNDSGMFEPNLRDERYLPFEGAGVVSEWHLELPQIFRQFDYDTISDVILHVRYTAKDGGNALKDQADEELQNALNEAILAVNRTGLFRLVSARHEFPNEWHRFLNPTESDEDQKLTLSLTKDRFPFLFQSKEIAINKVDVFVKVRPEFLATHNETSLKITLGAGDRASDEVINLVDWNRILQGTKEMSGEPGPWTLTAWLEAADGTHQKLNPRALSDVGIIFSYSLK